MMPDQPTVSDPQFGKMSADPCQPSYQAVRLFNEDDHYADMDGALAATTRVWRDHDGARLWLRRRVHGYLRSH